MRVLVTGATGMIGTALGAELARHGHEMIPLRRGHPGDGVRTWDIEAGRIDDDALEGIDAVVHLAARQIMPPFTAGRRREILESRTKGTALIAEAVARSDVSVFVCASAMGVYGSRGDEDLTEEATKGSGFLADVVDAWEAAAAPAVEAGVRTVFTRTALVMGRGPLLTLMSLPFRLFVGGPVGSGRQWWSWVSLEDTARAFVHCLVHDDLEGPVNVASPSPVRQREFAKALGAALHRPSWLPVPAFALRLVLGSRAAEDLVLVSQRVLPASLERTGFEFSHPELADALAQVY
jgi:uncharacterized protein (TIGR01777 family)